MFHNHMTPSLASSKVVQVTYMVLNTRFDRVNENCVLLEFPIMIANCCKYLHASLAQW